MTGVQASGSEGPNGSAGRTVPRVLFIGGYGRSGSTLLDRVLGEAEGVCSLGEVRHLWREGLVEDRRCGCGASFSACPWWTAVLERAFGPGGVDGERLVSRQRAVDCWWRVPVLAAGSSSDELREYLDALLRVYRAAAAVSRAGLLVDSSKDVSHGYLLDRLGPHIDLRMVHLVRDPRAVAYSWQRRKENPGSGRPMDRWPPWRTAIEWDLINAMTRASHWFGRPCLRIRYEDLTADPAGTVRRILTFAGEDPSRSPVNDEGMVTLSPSHTVAGNPDRFRSGPTRIAADQAWRAKLPPRARLAVTGLAACSLPRYGYALSDGIGPVRSGRRDMSLTAGAD